MATVAVNPPKTPVTKGSSGMATATLPNMCKMPPPPPPFLPTPLPNIGMSGKNPKKYSTTVKVEGQPVAIQGSTFDSVGDIASKGTGGGVVSNNAEGPTAFLAPGSLNVKIQGKNVQYLGDQMLNNCGPAGSPANSATMAGVLQAPTATLPQIEEELQRIANECEDEVENNPKHQGKRCSERGTAKHDCCNKKIEDDLKDTRKANPKAPQRTYSEPAFNKSNGSPVLRNNPVRGAIPSQVPRTQQAMVRQAVGFARSLKATGKLAQAIVGGMLRPFKFPDVVVAADPSQPVGRGNTQAIYDFKFPCPKGKKAKWGNKGKQGAIYNRMLQPSQAAKIISPR